MSIEDGTTRSYTPFGAAVIHAGKTSYGLDVFVLGREPAQRRDPFTVKVLLVDGPNINNHQKIIAIAPFYNPDLTLSAFESEKVLMAKAQKFSKDLVKTGIMPEQFWKSDANSDLSQGTQTSGKLLLPPAQTEAGQTHILLQKLGKKARVVIDSKDIDTGEMRVGQMYTLMRQKDGHIAVKSLAQEQEKEIQR